MDEVDWRNALWDLQIGTVESKVEAAQTRKAMQKAASKR